MSVFATPASRLVSHRQSGLQDYIAISRYARYSPSKRRRETWSEAVARVRDMHLTHYRDVFERGIAVMGEVHITHPGHRLGPRLATAF